MSTYKKPLKGIAVTSITDNNYSCEDKGINRYGSNAIADFERKDTIKVKPDEDSEHYIPFHAVKKVKYATFGEDAEKADPYCAEGGEPTYIIRWGDTSNPDTTGIKIGDSVVVPIYTRPGFDCSWFVGDLGIYAWGSEEDRTFEFTEEIANTAEDYLIVAITECWS